MDILSTIRSIAATVSFVGALAAAVGAGETPVTHDRLQSAPLFTVDVPVSGGELTVLDEITIVGEVHRAVKKNVTVKVVIAEKVWTCGAPERLLTGPESARVTRCEWKLSPVSVYLPHWRLRSDHGKYIRGNAYNCI